MKTAAGIIERRVNGLGVSEAEVQTQGSNHIIVNIPKGTDAKQARQQVGTTAQLGLPAGADHHRGRPRPPEPKPSPSQGGANGKGKGDKAAGDQASSRAPSSARRAPTSDDAGPRGHGRAEEGDPSAKPTPRPGQALRAHRRRRAPAGAASIPPALPEAARRAGLLHARRAAPPAGEKAANAKPSDPVVACEQDGDAEVRARPGRRRGHGRQRRQGRLRQPAAARAGSSRWTSTTRAPRSSRDITGKLAKQQQPQNQFAIVLDGEVVSAPSRQPAAHRRQRRDLRQLHPAVRRGPGQHPVLRRPAAVLRESRRDHGHRGARRRAAAGRSDRRRHRPRPGRPLPRRLLPRPVAGRHPQPAASPRS